MNLLNKKGFSLVELLAIIVVLSIIALIAYPIIGNVIDNSRDKLQKEQHNRIKSAAKNWVTANSVNETTGTCITISQLTDAGYLEIGDIKDPKGGTLNGGFQIRWVATKNQYSYEYFSGGCSGNNGVGTKVF